MFLLCVRLNNYCEIRDPIGAVNTIGFYNNQLNANELIHRPQISSEYCQEVWLYFTVCAMLATKRPELSSEDVVPHVTCKARERIDLASPWSMHSNKYSTVSLLCLLVQSVHVPTALASTR
jgi:hypothetical protein